MTQAAKAQEPSMEEILASIRRIIADDDGVKPAPRPEARAPEPPQRAKPPLPPRPVAAANKKEDIDAMMAGLMDEPPQPAPAKMPEPEPADVLELTEEMQAPAPAFRTIDATRGGVFDD